MLANYVWDDASDAHVFLHTEHPLLDYRTPAEMAVTEHGAQQIEMILWGLYYGLPA